MNEPEDSSRDVVPSDASSAGPDRGDAGDRPEGDQAPPVQDRTAQTIETEIGNTRHDARDANAANHRGSLIGRRLGDYQVLRKLGRGGMADVYVARQLSLNRDVALKVLKSDLALDKDYVARFRREARAAAKLNHPNIVQVYDVGSADTMHYIAQELVDGENLRDMLSRVGSLSSEEAIEVLVGVASALEVASEAGITHRDIKPDNIMRSSRGIVKVADFGLARWGADAGTSHADLTQAGLTLGTPRYMSPEQVQGQVVDVRSDLYSLGVTMYHLLAGRPPFEADDPLPLAVMHLHETPIPVDRARGRQRSDQPDIPEWLIAVVSRLMNKLPQDRYQSPHELLSAVRNETSVGQISGVNALGAAAATVRLQRVADEERRNRRRRVLRAAAAVVLPLICVAATAAACWQQPGKQIKTSLLSEDVAMKDTIQEQFINAVTRNDEAGWRAVLKNFPEKNSTNSAYHAKSLLQLAALFTQNQRWQDAQKVYEQLIRNPNVDRLYRAVAMARLCKVLEQLDNKQKLTETRRQLQTLYSEMRANNSQVADIFDDVVRQEDRLALGIGAATNGN